MTDRDAHKESPELLALWTMIEDDTKYLDGLVELAKVWQATRQATGDERPAEALVEAWADAEGADTTLSWRGGDWYVTRPGIRAARLGRHLRAAGPRLGRFLLAPTPESALVLGPETADREAVLTLTLAADSADIGLVMTFCPGAAPGDRWTIRCALAETAPVSDVLVGIGTAARATTGRRTLTPGKTEQFSLQEPTAQPCYLHLTWHTLSGDLFEHPPIPIPVTAEPPG